MVGMLVDRQKERRAAIASCIFVLGLSKVDIIVFLHIFIVIIWINIQFTDVFLLDSAHILVKYFKWSQRSGKKVFKVEMETV